MGFQVARVFANRVHEIGPFRVLARDRRWRRLGGGRTEVATKGRWWATGPGGVIEGTGLRD